MPRLHSTTMGLLILIVSFAVALPFRQQGPSRQITGPAPGSDLTLERPEEPTDLSVARSNRSGRGLSGQPETPRRESPLRPEPRATRLQREPATRVNSPKMADAYPAAGSRAPLPPKPDPTGPPSRLTSSAGHVQVQSPTDGPPPAEAEAPTPRTETSKIPERPEELFHEVRDGDTLESLATRYLGSPDRAGEIFEANRESLQSADLLPIGLRLRILK